MIRIWQTWTIAALVMLGSWASATPSWFDQSHEIFLTPQLHSIASHYQDYPLFWWNFLIVDGDVSHDALESLCADLATTPGVQKLPCHFNFKDLKSLTQDWLQDAPLRLDLPETAAIKNRMRETLAKASLPMGRDLIELLRLDPLDTLSDLRARLEKRMKMDLRLEGGFLTDASSHRVLLPLQFSYPPSKSDQTREFVASLNKRCAEIAGCRDLNLFGAHASTLENEARIRQDVEVVSNVGLAALVLLGVFLFATKRQRLLNLLPLLFFSIGISAWVTVLVFGKIHGITLAFGPGIVGLSMDYGIHSAFLDPRSKKTWSANWVGLQTTIVIMIILGFSAIPLLRQMMFFATFGLCFNYLVFYLVLPRWPERFTIEIFRFQPQNSRALTSLSAVFLIASPLLILQPLHLDVQHLNFESAKTEELRRWFFQLAGSGSPYIVIEGPGDPLAAARERMTWAATEGIPFESISSYLPPVSDQEAHLQSWRTRFCPENRLSLGESETKFFAPFLKNSACPNLKANALGTHIPDYLRDFHHDGHFVSLFFPANDAQVARLRLKYPEVSTPREIFASFPRILYAELLWMVPLAFFGAFFFLWLHYRQIGWSLLAVVPFLTGVGCYALVGFLFHLPLSFISLIGLLMVFGCSLDYGVFVMDFLLFRKGDKSGVWSALSLCAWATVAGFAPLVFAHHPVLNELGQALLWGTVGTYVGSLWAIPFVFRLWQKWRPA